MDMMIEIEENLRNCPPLVHFVEKKMLKRKVKINPDGNGYKLKKQFGNGDFQIAKDRRKSLK